MPSDIAAGLLLLNKSKDARVSDANEENGSLTVADVLKRAPAPWMSLKNAQYYAKYALESYNSEPKLEENCEMFYVSHQNSVYKVISYSNIIIYLIFFKYMFVFF